MRLGLATYNIHSCVGGDGRYDPVRILGVLKELDVDIIALQEVDSRAHRGLELMDWLAQETGLHAIAGPTLLRQTGKYGIRCEALRVRLIDLTVLQHEPRGAIDVDVNCDGHILQLIATHLGLRPGERRAQVQRVLEVFGTKHCVLMGDLNEWFLWGRPLLWIQAMFGRARHLATFPAKCPVLALDRIWVRPPGAVVQLTVHKTALARKASDHLPLKAVIELYGETSRGVDQANSEQGVGTEVPVYEPWIPGRDSLQLGYLLGPPMRLTWLNVVTEQPQWASGAIRVGTQNQSWRGPFDSISLPHPGGAPMRRVTLWTILPTCSTMLVLFAAGCTLKGTTNEITDTTSNVTVSTSGRTWFTEDGTLQPQHKLTAFTAFNQANLEQDLARGDGEYLTSLGTLLGVSKDQQAAFHAQVQMDFDRLVVSDSGGRLQHLQALVR